MFSHLNLINVMLFKCLCFFPNNSAFTENVFNFIHLGRPDQVHNCTITNISMTSLGVRCSEGFNGGLAQSFMLEVRDMNTQVNAKPFI